jgi:hypothetical protein
MRLERSRNPGESPFDTLISKSDTPFVNGVDADSSYIRVYAIPTIVARGAGTGSYTPEAWAGLKLGGG